MSVIRPAEPRYTDAAGKVCASHHRAPEAHTGVPDGSAQGATNAMRAEIARLRARVGALTHALRRRAAVCPCDALRGTWITEPCASCREAAAVLGE